MSTRITSLGVLLVMLAVNLHAGRIISVPENASMVATPEATPTETASPRFSLVPKGDHPEGYFKDIQIEPGKSVELRVVVDNWGTVPVNLRTYKVNALSAINGGYMSGDKTAPPIGATSWIDYPPEELQLEPGEQRQIAFTVSVPERATPGQYISGLVVETADPLGISGTDVLDQVIGHIITLSVLVPGEITYSFEVGEPDIVERHLQIPVANLGNYLVRPTGELKLYDSAGLAVLTSPISMGSVYSGLSTHISVGLPEQMPPGDYTLSLSLTDEGSGATASIEDVPVTVPEPVDPTGVSATSVAVEPNAEPIAFANVALTLNNGGQQIPATDVTLNVMRDGEEVESFPLATNQVLPNGETDITSRYIPADVWEPGTYTFEIVVSAVDPEGGTETVLATIDVEDEIVIP